MNRKQKAALIGGMTVVLLALVLWLLNGSEFFTKTQVLIDKKDELFGTTYKEWKNTLIPGLDFILAVSFITVIISLTLTYLLRTKRKEIA